MELKTVLTGLGEESGLVFQCNKCKEIKSKKTEVIS